MNSTLHSTIVSPDLCAQGTGDGDHPYDLMLHIVSVFVILILSLLGALISVVSSRFKHVRINPVIINTGKFFGSG
jgi:hypothetical protein